MATFGNPQDVLATPYGYAGQMAPETAVAEQALNRRRIITNLLMQQGMQAPQGQMAGRFYVAPSPLQHIAGLSQVLAGVLGSNAIDDKQNDLMSKDRKMVTDALTAHRTKTAPKTTQSEMRIDATRSEMPDTWDINELTGGVGVGSQQPPREGDTRAHYSPPAIPIRERNGSLPTTQTMPVETTAPASPEDQKQALSELLTHQHPQVRAYGAMLAQQAQRADEKSADREFLSTQKELDRDVRREGIQQHAQTTLAQLQNNLLTRQMMIDQAERGSVRHAELMKQQKSDQIEADKWKAKLEADTRKSHDETLKAIAGMKQESKGKLPNAALKMQNEELDAIATASSLKSDMASIRSQIESGKLKLGPLSNIIGQTKNALGASDENSRNLASFKATLERNRNESLRLNKGVQTEGDAVRAWNELIENINDPKVVMQRLSEIDALNERAANIRKMNVDTIRQNYNVDPLDTTGYERQPATVGGNKVNGSGPAVGTVEDGYRFKGGNPADPKSWERVP